MGKSANSKTTPMKQQIHNIEGIRLAAVEANIRYPDRLDLVLMEIAKGSTVAGVFTQNVFCAAPVVISKKHLAAEDAAFFLVNTGNANAGTGQSGLDAAEKCCSALAAKAGVSAASVLPFSTGVIGEALPVEQIEKALPAAIEALSDSDWLAAATGILTTDTRPKIASEQLEIAGKIVSITGIAKGSGMIKPNMATMLAYVFTDMEISQASLNEQLTSVVETSFNRITVDGDTSTNDCCMLTATGKSGLSVAELTEAQSTVYQAAVSRVFRKLAMDMIRDAEGASKFITIRVEGGATTNECLAVAYTVAESPLVKTAFFASDPNWGRILAAVGRSGLIDLDIRLIDIRLGECDLVTAGELSASYTETKGQLEMDRQEIEVNISLRRGDHKETVWTSDLSHDYVRINAEYRS